MSDPVEIALIGIGRMGMNHAEALAGLGHRVTAICDARPEALDAAGERLGVAPARRFRDAEALFARVSPLRLVVIATTAPAHCALVRLAAEAGAARILCEKPLAQSLADCDRMIDVCHERGIQLAVNHQMRFMPQYTLAKQLIEDEAFGGLTSMNVVGGCFGLAMNGTHYFEAFRYLTQAEPVEVTAWFSRDELPNPRGPGFRDQAGELRLVTADGRRLHMDVSADQGHGMTSFYAGRNGHLFVDEFAGEMILTQRLAEHRELPTTRYGMPWERRRLEFPAADNIEPTRGVLAALLAGKEYPSGEVGRLAVAVLVAAYVSVERGHAPVRLDDPGLPVERAFPWA